jgi:dihydrofolate reductase / thymidylate synthase
MINLNLILAVDKNFGISKNGNIPWHFPPDYKFFKEMTITDNDKQNIVIMGRNTWEKLPDTFKPLSNRINIIVSSTMDNEDLDKYKSKETCILVKTPKDVDVYLRDNIGTYNKAFVCGGSGLYDHYIQTGVYNFTVYITLINADFGCDNIIDKDMLFGRIGHLNLLKTEKYNDVKLDFCYGTTNPNNSPKTLQQQEQIWEKDYLKIIQHCLECEPRVGRNGTTFSCFQKNIHVDLSRGFPVMTTKKLYWKGVVEELLFFLKGNTDSQLLSANNVRIWDANTTREFLDLRGLEHYDIGDMGPMYGWNWRHFGAEYNGKDHNYSGLGFDQLKDVISKIINDPTNRRIMMTTFDPSKVSESVLAPCHSIVLQFYVDGDNLDMFMYQRSADIFLGVPFNITSNALLLSIIALAAGKKPRNLYITFGDTHLYEEHIEQAHEQLKREPYHRPLLLIRKHASCIENVNEAMTFIDTLEFKDFKLVNYESQLSIKADMVA